MGRPLPRNPLRTTALAYRSVAAAAGFRTLWVAALVSRAGDTINFVALALFVLAATGSAIGVATVVLAEAVGLVVGAVLAQLVVDRLPARPLLIGLDLARALIAATLAAAPSFATAVAVAFMLAAATAVFSPASSALLPRLVPGGELVAANSLVWTAGVAVQMLAAPLAGVLVGFASARIAFTLNAASFLASALVLRRLPALGRAAAGADPWRQLPDALRALPRVAVVPPLLAMQLLAALSTGATSALLVVLARDAYRLGAAGYGLWLAAIAAGAVAGPVLLSAIPGIAPARVVSGAYAVRGLGDMALSALSQGLAGGALLGLYGTNTSSGMVSFQTLVQQRVPEALRGRAFALLDATWQGGRVVSIIGGGALAAACGVRAVFLLGGILLVVSAAIGAWRLR